MSWSTSAALAPGWATMKLAWRSETSAPPNAGALQSGLIDQGPRRDVGRGVLEDAAGRLVAVRLVLLLDDPDPPHPADDGFGVLRRRARIRPRGSTGSSRLESRSAKLRSSRSRTWTSSAGSRTVARRTNWPIAPWRPPALPRRAPPTVPGMPVRTSRPRQPGPGGVGDQGRERDRGAGLDDIVPDRQVREERAFEVDHQGVDPLVANQDVGPAPQNLERDPFLPAPLQEGDQLVELARAGEIRGRSTQTEPDQTEPAARRVSRFRGSRRISASAWIPHLARRHASPAPACWVVQSVRGQKLGGHRTTTSRSA